MCCAVKEECGCKFTACELLTEQSEFFENILAFFPVPNPPQNGGKSPAQIAPIFHILSFGTRESFSTL